MTINSDISGKILVISEDYNGKGGVSTVVKDLLRYYETVNYIRSTARVNKLLQFFIYLVCILKMLYYFLFRNIDIVHIHSASYGSFFRKSILTILSKIFRKKVILHIHSGEFERFRKKFNFYKLIDRVLNIADTLIVLSLNWRDYFVQIVDPTKVVILNNLITPPIQIPLENKPISPINILFLGVITETKGIFDLMSALVENKKFLIGRIRVFIGGSGKSEKLIEIIKENKLNEMVQYEGWVDGKAKSRLLNKSNILILPSYFEGLPISILEGMSYGMPIIATKVGGIPSIVKNGHNGLLITPGSKKEIFESILYFINNKDQIQIMGNNSLNIIQEFYPDAVIPTLNKIYKKLLV